MTAMRMPAHGLPDGARKLKERIERAAGLMIAVPEYNYSIPARSRTPSTGSPRAPDALAGPRRVSDVNRAFGDGRRPRALADPHPARGLRRDRLPDMFALPHGNTAFDERGFLRDHAPFERLLKEVRGFVRFAEAVEPLCCAPPPAADAKQRAEQIAAALEEESELQPAAP